MPDEAPKQNENHFKDYGVFSIFLPLICLAILIWQLVSYPVKWIKGIFKQNKI